MSEHNIFRYTLNVFGCGDVLINKEDNKKVEIKLSLDNILSKILIINLIKLAFGDLYIPEKTFFLRYKCENINKNNNSGLLFKNVDIDKDIIRIVFLSMAAVHRDSLIFEHARLNYNLLYFSLLYNSRIYKFRLAIEKFKYNGYGFRKERYELFIKEVFRNEYRFKKSLEYFHSGEHKKEEILYYEDEEDSFIGYNKNNETKIVLTRLEHGIETEYIDLLKKLVKEFEKIVITI